ncbi:MAG: hypothetical protein U0Y08_06240 [Bacteroidia bacterium]
MFNWLARIILRNRLTLLILFGVITIFMGYEATKIQLSYDFAKILPESDPDFQAYSAFKKKFGEDGSVMVIGVRDSNFFTKEKFNDWFTLGNNIRKIDGIEAVVSCAQVYTVKRNDTLRKFDVTPLVTDPLPSQAAVDSIRDIIFNLPFYEGFIISKESHATLMAITFDKNKLNTKNRLDIVHDIKDHVHWSLVRSII